MQPMTRRCEYCGDELQAITVNIGGKQHVAGYRPCSCDQATAKRAEEQKAEKEREQAELAEKLRRNERRAGIPERYLCATHPEAKQLADSVEETGRGLYLYGSQGTEKTLLACAISRIWISRGRSVNFVVTTKLVNSLRSRATTDQDYMARLAGCDLLVLDDLDKVSPTAYACERIWELINDRYNGMLPVIVTSNCKRSEIASMFASGETGRAICSRLIEDTESILLDGPDRRLSQC